ncbi:tail fiber assembly protein [Escherichia coli]|uniref:tail fiber assembly protein n=1 Tax=Escherichia coli TaxID=562 RepID=UPI00113153F6|nr:tail fiber assembly protein [Escherichia coli]
MMSDKYRFSGNIFYPYSSKADFDAAGTWPKSGVDVDLNTYLTFIQQPPYGKLLGTDKKGAPCWIDIPPLTREQLITQAKYEKSRRLDEINTFINDRQWPGKTVLGRLTDDEKELYGKALDYLDELSALDPQDMPDNWPEFEGFNNVA